MRDRCGGTGALYTSCAAGGVCCISFCTQLLHQKPRKFCSCLRRIRSAFHCENDCCPDGDSTPFRSERRKRYNSLDLASKVVRQRRARPSLGTFPNTGKVWPHFMTLCIFAGIPFRPFFQKLKKMSFAKTSENKKRTGAALENVQTPIRFLR